MCTFRLAIVCFQQCIGIPMGTNCAFLLTDLLHHYESTAMILFSQGGTSPIPKSFSLTRRYIDDFITINNPRFDGAIGKIYPSALTLKETNLSVAMTNETISPSGYKIIPIWIAMSHACLCTGFISANFSVSLAPVIDTRIS